MVASEANRLRPLLRRWLDDAGSVAATLRESSPEHDPDDDYVVAYKAVFEPFGDGARVELWECDDGRIAVGFETRERVSAALDTKDRLGAGFATGNEPVCLTCQDILWMLERVSKGRIALLAKTLPVLGLAWIKGILIVEKEEEVDEESLARFGWLSAMDSDRANARGALRYASWRA